MKKLMAVILLLAGCASPQLQETNRKIDHMDKNLQTVIEQNVRRTCTMSICGQEFKIQQVTQLECIIIGRTLDNIMSQAMECRQPEPKGPAASL